MIFSSVHCRQQRSW